MTAQKPELMVYSFVDVVHGPTGDDKFCPLQKITPFFPGMRGNRGKAEKGCFPEKNELQVRKYASVAPTAQHLYVFLRVSSVNVDVDW